MSSKSELVEQLLVFPPKHPYAKWTGTHWRLVEIADSAVSVDRARLDPGVDAELSWLLSGGLDPQRACFVAGRARRHASMEGNAVYALSRLGYADHPGTRRLVDALLQWQWPDGGWNCDPRPDVVRSSFHESVTPGLGLAYYAAVTGDRRARQAAERAADLLLSARLFRSRSSGQPVHPSWTVLHYPGYWHYDVLQGLRLLAAVDGLAEPEAADALDVVQAARRHDGFASRRWSTTRQPAAVEWGRGTRNTMLNELAAMVLTAAGRTSWGPRFYGRYRSGTTIRRLR